MRLDRYDGKPFKYQVFRRIDGGVFIDPAHAQVVVLGGVRYALIDPADCFVVKRRDQHSTAALTGYANDIIGQSDGAQEYAADIRRLRHEWVEKTGKLGDMKAPD